ALGQGRRQKPPKDLGALRQPPDRHARPQGPATAKEPGHGRTVPARRHWHGVGVAEAAWRPRVPRRGHRTSGGAVPGSRPAVLLPGLGAGRGDGGRSSRAPEIPACENRRRAPRLFQPRRGGVPYQGDRQGETLRPRGLPRPAPAGAVAPAPLEKTPGLRGPAAGRVAGRALRASESGAGLDAEIRAGVAIPDAARAASGSPAVSARHFRAENAVFRRFPARKTLSTP